MKKKLMTLGLIAMMVFGVAKIANTANLGPCRTISVECVKGSGEGFTGMVCGDFIMQNIMEAVYFVYWCN